MPLRLSKHTCYFSGCKRRGGNWFWFSLPSPLPPPRWVFPTFKVQRCLFPQPSRKLLWDGKSSLLCAISHFAFNFSCLFFPPFQLLKSRVFISNELPTITSSKGNQGKTNSSHRVGALLKCNSTPLLLLPTSFRL